MSDQAGTARDRLRFHLELQPDFWFAMVVGERASDRNALREEVRGWCAEGGIDFHLHDPGDEGLAALALTIASSTETGLHWVMADASREAMARFLMALNERREALRKRLAAGLVLEGRVPLKVLLRNLAPDLFSIRACIVELDDGAEVEVPEQSRLQDPSDVRMWGQLSLPWQHWSDSQARARQEAEAALLDVGRLEGRIEPGARQSRLAALSRAVDALLAQGWVSEAAPIAEQMLAQARDLSPLDATEEVSRNAPTANTGVPTVTAGGNWTLGMTAEALEALGIVAQAQGDLSAAEDHWQEALVLRDGLIGASGLEPVTRGGYAHLARMYSRLGELSRRRGESDDAARYLDVALSLREQIRTQFPDRIDARNDAAIAHSLRGDLFLDDGVLDKASTSFETTLRLRRELVDVHGGHPQHRELLSVALGRMGVVEGARGRFDQALDAATESLELIVALTDADPGNATWASERATAHGRLADAARAVGDIDRARREYHQAVRVRRTLVEDDPENANWRHYLAVVLTRLGTTAVLQDDEDTAFQSAHEARRLLEVLVWEDPVNADWKRALDNVNALEESLPGERTEAE